MNPINRKFILALIVTILTILFFLNSKQTLTREKNRPIEILHKPEYYECPSTYYGYHVFPETTVFADEAINSSVKEIATLLVKKRLMQFMDSEVCENIQLLDFKINEVKIDWPFTNSSTKGYKIKQEQVIFSTYNYSVKPKNQSSSSNWGEVSSEGWVNNLSHEIKITKRWKGSYTATEWGIYY